MTAHKPAIKRCTWCGDDPLYIKYHDQEWGIPLHNDQKLFEMLILEGAQAGLSWITILRKREAYQKAFNQFDPQKIARYNTKKIESLLNNPGIVRNRLKVQSSVTNAKAFLKVVESEGSFDNYIWSFIGGEPRINHFKTTKEIPAKTPESEGMSKDLKRRGFKFIGATICYAFMQATGMVNDHTTDCCRHRQLQSK